jgi:hypothetical protein
MKALSEGGKITMPAPDMFLGAYFGMLTDKFGVSWMFNAVTQQYNVVSSRPGPSTHGGSIMPSTPRSKTSVTTTNSQVASFIAKFDPSVAKVIRSCRTALRKRFPTANEIIYDNYNFFVIGYSSTERPSDCIVSIAAASNGVGLSFYYGSTLPDPEKRLLGNGKQNRFIRLPSASVLGEPAVDALLQAAADQGDVPLVASGRGRTIVQSISAKQRPRR